MGQLKYCDWCKDYDEYVSDHKLAGGGEPNICDTCWNAYRAAMRIAHDKTIDLFSKKAGRFNFIEEE